MNKTTFRIPGLDCPAEEKLIRNKLKNINEISDLEFNFILQELRVTHTLKDIKPIQAAISQIGMQAITKDASLNAAKLTKKPVVHTSWILMGIAAAIALSAEIYAYIANSEKSIIVISLSILAILLTGGPTFKKGYLAIRSFTMNINFLMMVAITGAVLIGEWPEAAMVTVLFALAELIERYSLDKARHAIEGLMDMAPEEAYVKNKDNFIIKPIADILVDDIIKVRPGDRIAMDGVLVNGQSSVNQAPVTGESIPVQKNVGDVVYAGTINQNGAFEFKVTATSNNSLLAKIIHSVEEAQNVKAPTQRFVDQFSKYYTPIMVVLAILIAIIPPLIFSEPFYPWLYKSLVLLVIACPCALVISTPVTVVSGLAAAAKYGLIVKGGIYLENGHKLKALALDKTGTLTEGQPVITDLISLNGATDNQVLTIAASLDSQSEHPIANAIVKSYNETFPDIALLQVENFSAIPGRGATALVDNVKYYVGNHQLAEDINVCNSSVEKILDQYENEGKTTVVVATGKQVIGIIAVADKVRNNAANAISTLHKLGVKTVMITGDNKITARAIAAIVGIDEVYANMLPEDKLQTIDNLIEKYKYVGMVGDGINDAPALAKSSIGFAMGADGTDIALETADIALMENNLEKLPLFIRLSKKHRLILIQNISFAIIVKIIFFILAISGKATLWMAVFADMGASLVVVFNGLRLLKFRQTQTKTCKHDCKH